jgi:DNA-directed RNA polymerase specialized sigma subunit
MKQSKEVRGIIIPENDKNGLCVPYQVKGFPVDKSTHIPSKNVFATMKDIEIWYHFIRWYGHPNADIALSFLIQKYDRFLHKIAHQLSKSNNHEFEYHDFLGFAHQGFLYSVLTYDYEKGLENGSSLNTWLHSNSYPYANNQRYASRMVGSNSHLRQDIKYAAGGYDSTPELKEKFEKQRNWSSDTDIALALQRVKLLDSPAMFSELTDNDEEESHELLIADSNVLNESQLTLRLLIDDMKNIFDDIELKIFEYHFEQEMNAQEVSKELDMEYRKTLNIIKRVREKSQAFYNRSEREVALV